MALVEFLVYRELRESQVLVARVVQKVLQVLVV
jgi:hypothetical protein